MVLHVVLHVVLALAGESGFLAWREIQEMIAAGAQVVTDPTAKAAYLVQVGGMPVGRQQLVVAGPAH